MNITVKKATLLLVQHKFFATISELVNSHRNAKLCFISGQDFSPGAYAHIQQIGFQPLHSDSAKIASNLSLREIFNGETRIKPGCPIRFACFLRIVWGLTNAPVAVIASEELTPHDPTNKGRIEWGTQDGGRVQNTPRFILHGLASPVFD
jgi:hypothetical protein